MIKITQEVIEQCASNLLFRISDAEEKVTEEEFAAIMKQMSFLGEIPNIDDEEPMTFPVADVQYILREDIPCEPMDVAEEMKMVPSRLGNQVKLPKVVG